MALLLLSQDQCVVTRKEFSIVLAHGEKGSYVASDIIAVIEASEMSLFLAATSFAVIEPDGISYTDVVNPSQPKVMLLIGMLMLSKGGYPDFMLKEIREQLRVIRDTRLQASDQRRTFH